MRLQEEKAKAKAQEIKKNESRSYSWFSWRRSAGTSQMPSSQKENDENAVVCLFIPFKSTLFYNELSKLMLGAIANNSLMDSKLAPFLLIEPLSIFAHIALIVAGGRFGFS